ncbi:MAG: hypothetical protein RI564_12810 [Gracilimonas sp.]|nr:hypothetical protein [Gracilimonas sp.]
MFKLNTQSLSHYLNGKFLAYSMVILIITLFYSWSANGQDKDNGSLLTIVKDYAEAMIEDGRDIYGEEHSPLFAAVLNRETMDLGSVEIFGSVPGVREGDRSIEGANPQEDTGLYAILYELTELTGEEKYAREADKALKFFFNRGQSPETGLLAWGEHLFWDLVDETYGGGDIHEINGEWPYWDQSYTLAPDASWNYVIGLWDHQIANKETGNFARHTKWSEHGPETGTEFPRYAGQMILDWAIAYDREENKHRERRDDMLEAISVVIGRMEHNMSIAKAGYLPAGTTEVGDHINVAWMPNNLEMARTFWKAKPYIEDVDKDLADRMEKLALEQDLGFHQAPHKISSGGGFATTLHAQTGEPRTRDMNKPYTAVWATGYGHGTHAELANLSFKRHEQLKKSHSELANKYKVLILAAAEQYLSAEPNLDDLHKPDAFSSIIELMLHAYSLTDDKKYLNRADEFGRISIDLFLDDDLPLPKATNQHSHYEANTGGAEWMHTLLKLYLVQQNYLQKK